MSATFPIDEQLGSLADHICTAERTRLQALVAADMATARPLHAADFQLITPIGKALSKDEYLGAIAAGHIKYLQWEPGAIEIRVHAHIALLRYQAQLEVVFGGHHVRRRSTGTPTPTSAATAFGRWCGRRPRRSAEPARPGRKCKKGVRMNASFVSCHRRDALTGPGWRCRPAIRGPCR